MIIATLFLPATD